MRKIEDIRQFIIAFCDLDEEQYKLLMMARAQSFLWDVFGNNEEDWLLDNPIFRKWYDRKLGQIEREFYWRISIESNLVTWYQKNDGYKHRIQQGQAALKAFLDLHQCQIAPDWSTKSLFSIIQFVKRHQKTEK